MFFRAKLRFCLWLSRVKKQEGHDSHTGKESQRPRLQELQREPVTPGRHKHAPVCLLQTSGRVPSRSHWHPGKEKSDGMLLVYFRASQRYLYSIFRTIRRTGLTDAVATNRFLNMVSNFVL